MISSLAASQIGVGFLARFDAVEKVADVTDVLVLPIARGVFGAFGPGLSYRFGHRLGSAHGMAADDPRHDVHRVFLGVWENLEPVSAQEHGAFGPVKFQAAHAGGLNPGRAFAPL